MKLLPLFFLLILPGWVWAQTVPPEGVNGLASVKRIDQTVDLGVSTNGEFTTFALSINRLHGLWQSKRFRVGYGLRFSSAFGTNTNYRTAPASLVKGPGGESALGLFVKNIEANIDTLRLPKTQANSLNVSLNLEYAISHRVDVGFNIDLIGLTFGPNQSGTFLANSPVRSPLSGTVQDAKLTAFNVLLGDQSDRGSLNSEGYVRYRFSDRVSLRGGIRFIVHEYTTQRKLTFENDRFRASNANGLLAVAYHF
ncbi:hypothetical protein [Spirosoma linguale]|uniref:Outer membrane protein beta-barrel domain-containing protein n=1 Tax=Spirosoma linguale (strain ATCC 33905 / DSM 74 / LMG 10896 / Claus 1) TaxID=504472 RepID=D2QGK4_SPILD|nr:hypothetical protein Slin_2493 [Spirosoma linguale DSM 74]